MERVKPFLIRIHAAVFNSNLTHVAKEAKSLIIPLDVTPADFTLNHIPRLLPAQPEGFKTPLARFFSVLRAALCLSFLPFGYRTVAFGAQAVGLRVTPLQCGAHDCLLSIAHEHADAILRPHGYHLP